MQKGVVKWYDRKKRFGFIVPDSGEKDIFVHVSSVAKLGCDMLDEGQAVEFEIGENNNRPCAINLRLV